MCGVCVRRVCSISGCVVCGFFVQVCVSCVVVWCECVCGMCVFCVVCMGIFVVLVCLVFLWFGCVLCSILVCVGCVMCVCVFVSLCGSLVCLWCVDVVCVCGVCGVFLGCGSVCFMCAF